MTDEEKIKLYTFTIGFQKMLNEKIEHGKTLFSHIDMDPTFIERLVIYLTIDNVKLNNHPDDYEFIKDYIFEVLEELDQEPNHKVLNLQKFIPEESPVIDSKDNVIKVDFTKKKK